MTEEHLIIQKLNAVAIVTLNRPEARNAFNGAMARQLEALIDRMADALERAAKVTG